MSLTIAPNQAEIAGPRELPAGEVDAPEFEIRSRRGWVAIDWKELFHYRELLYFLVWRDVKVRYKQTVLGFAWAIIQPVATMIIFGTIFGSVAGFDQKIPEELLLRHIPYNLFVYAGLLPWTLFAVGLSSGGTSLMNQQNLLTKVYFPRLFVPASVVGAAVVDTLISFGVFFILMAFACLRQHCAPPPWTIVFIIPLLLLTVLAAMAVSFALSALTVTYRDFRFLIPFIVQIWTFTSPVYYPSLHSGTPWKEWILRLNPMDGMINAYRSALLGQRWDLAGLAICIVEFAILLIFGLYYFKKTERRFADIA